ncbi:MAG TPA: insulinase family protein [Bryobacteraceae bacterium]|jgi:zinc protease|nr:insulinase family protein [Bryobacteraceae bacterium]
MKPLVLLLLFATAAWPQIRVVAQPNRSQLVDFRVVFMTGAAYDPPAKPGLASLTAALIADGGNRELTYKQVLAALYPMAASISSQTDKEMITFRGSTDVQNLEKYYALFRAALLTPGWREDDLRRIRDRTINYLRVGLRESNEEELAKEVLYQTIFAGRPYGSYNAGTVASLQGMTMGDLRRFYELEFTQTNLVIGIGGGFPPGFPERVKKDFEALPLGAPSPRSAPAARSVGSPRAVLIEKPTRSVAISLGTTLDVRRGHPDYPALLVAQSYFGQHRSSGGRLFSRMREGRGLNYGDYAYIEYFPQGMFRFEPEPNLARKEQIFQIWIRPVPPQSAHFALRLALFEFDKLIHDGLTQESFERTRSFLSKNVNLLVKTRQAELGYAIDSLFYGIPDYKSYLSKALARLTLKDVNAAIARHLRTDDIRIVAVAQNCRELGRKLSTNALSPMTYNSPKPEAVLEEDKIVERWRIDLKPESVQIVPAGTLLE